MAKSVVKRKKPRAQRKANAWDQLPMEKGWHAVQYHIHYLIDAKEWLNKVKTYIKNNYDKKNISISFYRILFIKKFFHFFFHQQLIFRKIKIHLFSLLIIAFYSNHELK